MIWRRLRQCEFRRLEAYSTMAMTDSSLDSWNISVRSRSSVAKVVDKIRKGADL